jgi:deazaflavin-dependent oxidoreductase (nitroreductase family)
MASALQRAGSNFFEKKIVNPPNNRALQLGLAPAAFALLETRGRRSGRIRRTAVGSGLTGDTFWLVSERGEQAAYVRNIAADPHVRVKVRRTWHEGVATILADDDARGRLDAIAQAQGVVRRVDAAILRSAAETHGCEPITIRIDLGDPA